jgi:hypothetical protein
VITPLSSGVTTLIRRPEDTADWISAAKLAEVVDLVAEIVEAVQGHAPEWARA